MDPEALAHVGKLLIGSEWQRPMARLLGPWHPAGARDSLDPRLVQRWASGERPVPAWVASVLAHLLEERADVYRRWVRECEVTAEILRSLNEDGDLRPGG